VELTAWVVPCGLPQIPIAIGLYPTTSPCCAEPGQVGPLPAQVTADIHPVQPSRATTLPQARRPRNQVRQGLGGRIPSYC